MRVGGDRYWPDRFSILKVPWNFVFYGKVCNVVVAFVAFVCIEIVGGGADTTEEDG